MPLKLTNPIHLYRALLRETTYLFDHNARRWTYNYVQSTFRVHAACTWDGKRRKTVPYNPTITQSLHERHLLKKGRRFLSTLQRANQGYTRALKNVLQLTYGRKGRRRRNLVGALMRPDTQTTGNRPDAAGNEPKVWPPPVEPPAKYSSGWKPPKDFMALLHTQNQFSDFLTRGKTIRAEPLVNKQNRWGNPMPSCRVKNITRKWYAKMASILMPPLPEREWNKLRLKALNKEEFKIIPRRPTARMVSQHKRAEDTEAMADSIVLGHPRVLGAKKMHSEVGNPHKLTQRFLSRFYGQHVLRHAPLAAPQPESRGLVPKWDDGVRTALNSEQPKSDKQIEALFG